MPFTFSTELPREELPDVAAPSGARQFRQVAAQAQCLAHEQRLGFGHLRHPLQADALALRWLRNSGLKWVAQMPEAKALFVRQALGLSGDLPELARA